MSWRSCLMSSSRRARSPRGALGLGVPWRRIAGSIIGGSLALTIAASAWIQPGYLSYFNWASGGPDRVPVRLIDSNLDWGQDLVELQRWWRDNIPDQPIGLAYFGQFNPSIFELRGEPFRWFLPPGMPGRSIGCPAAESPADRTGPQADPRLLRGERDLAVRAALAALRPGPARIRSPKPSSRPGATRSTP